ncbi:MAG: HTH domain-containing protein, partial [Chloroflexota bacterium]|nr:HTH domain-containing protein [Chloroflexota bacterium]
SMETRESVGQTFLGAARQVLEEAGEPLHPRVITERALAAGLVRTSGKTPEATMAAQIYTSIQRQGELSRFVRVGRGLFGLRSWGLAGPPPKRRAVSHRKPPTNVVSLAQEPAERIAAEVMTAQHDSTDSVRFERALTEAFSFLGFQATHVGGAGQTDIVLDAPISAGRYRVVVDAKSNRSGRVADGQIDWNSLRDHRKAAEADYVLVIAPGFGGGNLLRRADEYGVALLPAASVAELVRLHRDVPFSLVELRSLFEASGPATQAVEQLQNSAAVTRGRWRLVGELIALVEELPVGVYADAQKLWLLLSFQHKENAPSRDAVEDAVSILASRALGVLRPINGSGEYQLTMQAETAKRRVRAFAQAVAGELQNESSSATVRETASGLVPRPAPHQTADHQAASPLPDFNPARGRVLARLQSLGFGPPEIISKRHVRLRKVGKHLGLAFRASRMYADGKWWWTFAESADHAPLAGCDAIVLVGLMQDPADLSQARPEVMFLPWQEAVETGQELDAWLRDRRLHVYVSPNTRRWARWLVKPDELTTSLLDGLLSR